jgi:L-threonylcarbamoyladenylate synthase
VIPTLNNAFLGLNNAFLGLNNAFLGLNNAFLGLNNAFLGHMDHMDMDMEELLLEPSPSGLQEAACLLQTGQLLAFPTETVYGLGANALQAEAVFSIFRAKGRPLTDPLIVHVANVADADRLIDTSEEVLRVFHILAAKFWPGPLTMITKASSLIPLAVTANTGFVGIRCPKHTLARKLIELAGVPVAAPSANRFGHVSPTRAQHVLDDLGSKGVKVLNGESQLFPVDSSCEFGIESTVVRLAEQGEIWIYRQGAISQRQIEDCLASHDISWTVKAVKRTVDMHKDIEKPIEEVQVGEEAPGQAVTHYAPDVRCYLLESIVQLSSSIEEETYIPFENQLSLRSSTVANTVVCLDFAAQCANRSHQFLAYRDLSPSGNSLEAAQSLFDSLRWTEQVEGAKIVLVSPILQDLCQSSSSTTEEHDLSMGLADRIFRAASGQAVVLKIQEG